jgi:hypothetical protein
LGGEGEGSLLLPPAAASFIAVWKAVSLTLISLFIVTPDKKKQYLETEIH